MSDRGRWESKRRSPDRSDYRYHHKSSSISDRHKSGSSHHNDRNHHSESRQYNNRFHEKDKEYKRDYYHRSHEPHRKSRDSSDRDRYNEPRNGRSRSSSSSSYSSHDRRHTPPPPKEPPSMPFTNYKLSDNSSSSSPYSTPPSGLPPPPPPPPSQPPRTNHTYPVQQNVSQSYFPKNTNELSAKTCDPRMAVSKNQKVEKKDTRNFKLLIDPTIKKGHTKIVRYDGILTGQAPVVPKDPRRMRSKIWTLEICDLPVPSFKIDKNFVGPMPRDTVRFSGLNDNVDRKFLYELCEAYGDIKEYKVYFDPKTNKHTGMGKVVFELNTPTGKVVAALDGRSVMGNIVTACIEVKNPPGHSILMQLEAECAAKFLKQVHPLQPVITPHQATPPTPSISSLQRHHPIASFQSYHQSPSNHLYGSPVSSFINTSDITHPPPPPPLPLGRLIERPSSVSTPPLPPPSVVGYENVSPSLNTLHTLGGNSKAQLPTIKKIRHSNNHTSSNHSHRQRNYSPVSNSDQSNSPRSPSRKEGAISTNYEAISDSEPHVEDISPAISPNFQPTKTKQGVEDDDDAMSLSSISSNEDHKVELNVQNVHFVSIEMKNTEQMQHNNSTMPTPLFPMLRPPDFPPPPIQPNLFPPGPNTMNNLQQPMSSNVNFMGFPATSAVSTPFPPPYQNQPMNSQNMPLPPSRPPLPPQTQPRMPVHQIQPTQPYLTQRHSEILQNALRRHNHTPPSMISNQRNIMPPVVQQQQAPPHYPKLPPQSSLQQPQNIPQPQPAISNPVTNPSLEELPFLFQVKAGCARDISKELKRILGKDTLKKLVEQSAFKAYENWFERQRSEHENTSSVLSESVPSNIGNKYTEKRKSTTENNHIKTNNTSEKDTASVLLQSLFGRDKNNENRMPSSFLGSFRITRRQQPSNNISKDGKKTGKRRPWPSIDESKRKHQRIEDSDDEDDVMNFGQKDEDEDEEEQLEQFALQQRKVQKSGSSLYQKIYSDESDEDRDTQSEDDDDEHDKQTTVTEESSSSSSSSSEEESSSSCESESESESEPESAPLQAKTQELVDKEQPKKHKKQVSTEKFMTTVALTDEPDVSDDKTSASADSFRSMYDEPRRKAAVESKQKLESSLRVKEGKPKNQQKETVKNARRPAAPKIRESDDSGTESGSETDSSSETESTLADEENTAVNKTVVGHDEAEGESKEEVVEDTKENLNEEVQRLKEEAEKSRREEEFINDPIMLEHNYFSVPPCATSPPEDAKNNNNKKEQQQSPKVEKILREILIDNDRNLQPKLKRHRKDLIKGELKYKFQMRTKEQERVIIWDIHKGTLDAEDLRYMKEAFESLKQVGSKDIASFTWADLTPFPVPPPHKVKRTKADLRPHVTGCARAEGYYKIPMAEKARYLKSALRQLKLHALQGKGGDDQQASSTVAGTEHKIKSRENRAMQRRLASSFAQEEFASLINYNQHLKMRKKALRFAKSSIHNWGLFACEPIAAEEFVCEYVGQMVRSIVAELREQRYEKSGIGSSYLFRLDSESVIDATKAGCNARFINHSCQPNCYAKVILVEGAKKIVIYSKREIPHGEEITYDYKFPLEDEKIPCLCGAPSCRGSLN